MAFRSRILKAIPPILLLVALLLWGYIISQLSPEALVMSLGVDNAYIGTFIISLVGGLSTFITVPYQLVVITFGAGGLDPWLLGLAAGIGLMIGDATSYLIGYHGRDFVPRKVQVAFKKIYGWLATKPKPLTFLTIFIYGAIFPIPNDFLVIPLGLIHFPYWKMAIPLTLGNILSNALLAYFGTALIQWLM